QQDDRDIRHLGGAEDRNRCLEVIARERTERRVPGASIREEIGKWSQHQAGASASTTSASASSAPTFPGNTTNDMFSRSGVVTRQSEIPAATGPTTSASSAPRPSRRL